MLSLQSCVLIDIDVEHIGLGCLVVVYLGRSIASSFHSLESAAQCTAVRHQF